MALSTVVKLLDEEENVLIETRARHWDAAGVQRELKGARWRDEAADPGYSDYVTDLDGATAQSLYEQFLTSYRKWIAFSEESADSHRNRGETSAADAYAKVADEDKAELAHLAQIVERAVAQGLVVRILLEEWSSGM